MGTCVFVEARGQARILILKTSLMFSGGRGTKSFLILALIK